MMVLERVLFEVLCDIEALCLQAEEVANGHLRPTVIQPTMAEAKEYFRRQLS